MTKLKNLAIWHDPTNVPLVKRIEQLEMVLHEIFAWMDDGWEAEFKDKIKRVLRE